MPDKRVSVFVCKKCGYQSEDEEWIKDCEAHSAIPHQYRVGDKIKLSKNNKIYGTVVETYPVYEPTLWSYVRIRCVFRLDNKPDIKVHEYRDFLEPLLVPKRKKWESEEKVLSIQTA